MRVADPAWRWGVFGGAFDPPHLAHVRLVEAAIEQLQLQQVRIIPTGEAWHKPRLLSDAVHRLAMARLAFRHLPQVTVDEREIHRDGPSYTIDTLTELKTEFPQTQWYLLLGDDQRKALPAWHRIEEIGHIAIICAAGRDSSVRAWTEGAPAEPPLSDTLQARIQTLQMPPMPQSATDVRERVAHHQPITGWVSSSVERYIHEHHLYRPHP